MQAQCYGTISVRKQNSLHIHNYCLHLLETSLMYTTVYMYTVIVYEVTLVHDKYIIYLMQPSNTVEVITSREKFNDSISKTCLFWDERVQYMYYSSQYLLHNNTNKSYRITVQHNVTNHSHYPT